MTRITFTPEALSTLTLAQRDRFVELAERQGENGPSLIDASVALDRPAGYFHVRFEWPHGHTLDAAMDTEGEMMRSTWRSASQRRQQLPSVAGAPAPTWHV